MTHPRPRAAHLVALPVLALAARGVAAQQFNSDSYLSKPAGVATVIATVGERNDMLMTAFSLLPGWEFTTAVYVVNKDSDPNTDDGYSTSFFVKYMPYENRAKTGGVGIKAGTGVDPGYLTATGLEDAFQTYWMNAPATIPFLNNRLSLDIMPGVSYTRSYGVQQDPAWAFTYSTRLAYYPRSPKFSLVGEVFGADGQLVAIPEYKAGLRWEPSQHETFALTYGQEFTGSNGARLEVGMMLFTPPFFCIRGCRDR